ncbi:very-short-patch-repair endonuclease [Priestia megaterium]|jgi:hypothetical protein
MNGYSIRIQVKCDPYQISFVMGRLAIEFDGKEYHSLRAQKALD